MQVCSDIAAGNLCQHKAFFELSGWKIGNDTGNRPILNLSNWIGLKTKIEQHGKASTF